VSNGSFYSLYDMESLAEAMVTPFDAGAIEAMDVDELLGQLGGEAILLKLLHDQLFEHWKVRGLQVDYGLRRAYFARGDEPELKISYQGRLRKATRTVVKARTKRDSEDVVYYEHKAVSSSLLRFGDAWGFVLSPGYAFTRDGIRNPISRERTNSLSTRRAARDFQSHRLAGRILLAGDPVGRARGLVRSGTTGPERSRSVCADDSLVSADAYDLVQCVRFQ